ncbi:MAG: NAD(P)/FAD-dependent oxidoreductase [Hyphomicrobiaceae bacterium]
MKSDVIVLGAGMVGISAALHLLKRGRSVTLIDRRGPAEETSYGNAGLIQREGVVPYMFPRDLSLLLTYARNNSTDASYHLSALPRIAPWMFRYWLASTPEGKAASARAMLPLVERCIVEHEEFMGEAGILGMVRRTGYLKVFRSPDKLDAALALEQTERAVFGINYTHVDQGGLGALEPHLSEEFAGGIHMTDPVSVADPGAVGRAYAELLVRKGGRFVLADARSLEQTQDGWAVATKDGTLTANAVVLALGPWSDDIFRPLGYDLPLGWKRGYHMHYRAKGNATLSRPVIDAESGFLMTPMTKGIRLTTGAEFALRDAPKTPVQLERVEPIARRMFPLGERIEAEPWLGRRPALPDMVPVIGPAPRHNGLWFTFGHHHLGFTLGPVTGRLLAEMMTSEAPFTDPSPYRADRF